MRDRVARLERGVADEREDRERPGAAVEHRGADRDRPPPRRRARGRRAAGRSPATRASEARGRATGTHLTAIASDPEDAAGLGAPRRRERQGGEDQRADPGVVVPAAGEVHREDRVPADERDRERPPAREPPGEQGSGERGGGGERLVRPRRDRVGVAGDDRERLRGQRERRPVDGRRAEPGAAHVRRAPGCPETSAGGSEYGLPSPRAPIQPYDQYVQASVESSSGAASGTSWIAAASTITARMRGGVRRIT